MKNDDNRPSGDSRQADRLRIDSAATAFDIDGVAADTMSQFLDIARELFAIRHLRYQDITSYNLEDCLDLAPEVMTEIIRHILDGSERVPLQPIDGAPEALARIGRQAGSLLFVTARPDGAWIEQWLRGVIAMPPERIRVVATGDFDAKLDVLRGLGIRTFVEDRLETCYALAGGGITPVVYRQPWNRVPHPFQEVGSWQEIETLLLS